MRSACFSSVLLLALSGCGGFIHVPTEVSAPGMADTDRALRESVARVNQAMNEMDARAVAVHKPTTGAYVPAELQRPVSAAMAGTLDRAAQALAERVGYRFASNATPGTVLVPVTLPGQPLPVIDLFRTLGAQAGQRADVLVNADRRQVEVRYHG